MQILDIVMRIVHIGSAIALLGGAVFILVAAMPAMRLIDEGLRGSIVELMRKRFYRITHPALLLLIVSGGYNFWRNLDAYRDASRAIHGLLGVKILLALALVVIVFAQAFGVIKGCPRRWTTISVVLGLVIVVLAAIVRAMRLGAI